MGTQANTAAGYRRVVGNFRRWINTPATSHVETGTPDNTACAACGEQIGPGKPGRLCRECMAELES